MGIPTETDVVLFDRIDDHVALITLNRPEKRHAVNVAVAQRLAALVKDTEHDPSIWATVITSSGGPAFCAGADLADVSAGRAGDLVIPGAGFAGLVDAPRRKPWIAAIRGSALGGGLEISLACDLRVCAEDTVFGLPEVKRGLLAAAGGTYRLPRQIPRAIALEMIATGEPISSARAAALGFVNAVVPEPQVIETALVLARKICANAPLAVRESLALARVAQEMTDSALYALTREAIGRLQVTEDYAEGPRAFVEKRAPRWTGK